MLLNVVIFLTGEYETSHRRYMIEALAKVALGQASILCVNPVVSPLGSLVRQEWGALRAAYREGGMTEVAPNLFVLTPAAPLYSPLGRFVDLKERAWGRLGSQIRSALAKVGPGLPAVAWVYRPEQIGNLELAGEQMVVYECYDEYTLNVTDVMDAAPKVLPEIVALEARLLAKADIVFTTSEALWESRRKRHANVHLAPNGADFDFYSKALDPQTEVPERITALPHPRIGYLGDVTERVDFGLLAEMGARHPEWSFVFLGTIRRGAPRHLRKQLITKLRELQRYRNLHFLGWVPEPEIPGALTGIDVATLPYLVNEQNIYVNSNKLWNYMAAGRAIVAMDSCPEIHRLREIVYVADSRQDFVPLLEKALTSDSKKRIEKGQQLAQAMSWPHLTQKMWDILLEEMYKRRLVTSTL